MFLLTILNLSFLLHGARAQCPSTSENAQDSQGLDLGKTWPSVEAGKAALVPCPEGYWTANRDEGLYGITRMCTGNSFDAPVGSCSLCPEGCKSCTTDAWSDCVECQDGWGPRNWGNNTDACYELNCKTDFFDRGGDNPCGVLYKPIDNYENEGCAAGDVHACGVSDCCRQTTYKDKTSELRTASWGGIAVAGLLLFMGTWSFLRQNGIFQIFACSFCPRTVRSLMEAPPKKPDSLKNYVPN